MQTDEISAMHKKIAGMRFIAELSLIANCKSSDLKLALSLIADLANSEPRIEADKEIFTLQTESSKGGYMRVDITIDKEQKLSQATLQAFEAELHRKVIAVFPATKINIRKGTTSGVEVAGFNLESDRETLNSILQDVWQQDGWS